MGYLESNCNSNFNYSGNKGVGNERVIHDSNQIIDISQLKEGSLYQMMRRPESEDGVFEFLGFSQREGYVKIKQEDLEFETSLADMGIISYGRGWNPTNYVIPVEMDIATKTCKQ